MATSAPPRADVEVARRVDEAKSPITPAAGPYGHPFHPILVTLPIGAWIASLVFDIASRVNGDGAPSLVEGAYWLIAIGVLGALLAAVFGLLDLLAIPSHSKARSMGLVHLALNLSVVAMFVVDFFWRGDTYHRSATPIGPLVLSAVAIAVLAVSGWIGGMLTYRYGVRVAQEAVQADGFR